MCSAPFHAKQRAPRPLTRSLFRDLTHARCDPSESPTSTSPQRCERPKKYVYGPLYTDDNFFHLFSSADPCPKVINMDNPYVRFGNKIDHRKYRAVEPQARFFFCTGSHTCRRCSGHKRERLRTVVLSFKGTPFRNVGNLHPLPPGISAADLSYLGRKS